MIYGKKIYVVSCHSLSLFNEWHRREGVEKNCMTWGREGQKMPFCETSTSYMIKNYGRDLLCNKYICLEKEGICKYFWQRSHRCFPWLSGFYNVLPNFVPLVKSRATCDHGNVIENLEKPVFSPLNFCKYVPKNELWNTERSK